MDMPFVYMLESKKGMNKIYTRKGMILKPTCLQGKVHMMLFMLKSEHRHYHFPDSQQANFQMLQLSTISCPFIEIWPVVLVGLTVVYAGVLILTFDCHLKRHLIIG